MQTNRFIRKYLRALGYDIVAYQPHKNPLARRMRLMSHYGVEMVFDVGAAIGQYGQTLRDLGYRGKIVSFEPIKSSFEILQRTAERDPLWSVEQVALGNKDGEVEINVAKNSDSSSILEMLPFHSKAAPNSTFIGRERVPICKVDTLAGKYYPQGERLYLKMDVQGFEREVLEGASISLGRVVGIQLEMSLVPLYYGGTLFPEMMKYLEEKGYSLMSLESGFTDPASARLLQVDGIFFRS